jgi:AraC-like DNA-binding protein
MDWTPGYRELPPPPALRPAVTCLWANVAPPEGGTTLVLPDACSDLIWEQGRGVHVAGPDTGPWPAPLPPGTILAGIRFGPGQGGSALGMPLSALLNQRVDTADLGSRAVADVERLPADAPPGVALRAMTGAVAVMLADHVADPLATAAVRLLRQPRVRADEVAARLGVSERQLRRRCQAAAGYGPATLRRVLRFQRFVAWLDRGGRCDGDLAQAAADLGYADQPHLSRETVSLAGMPPGALAVARHPR